ncbi:hypothetical protein [Geodermatophilus sp. URMC 63]
MTDPEIPSAYVRDKRTPPPSREELRARIPGWGADLDPADRPSYPKLQYPADTGAHWDFPERQPQKWPREHSIEHAFVTPVFGTAQPPKGLSGAIRKLAYARFSEGRLAHWLLLIVGDRVDAWEHHLRSFASARPDVPATGVRAEFTHGGLRSRRGRSDARHQLLDPVVVAGPWVAGAGAAVLGVRRVVRALRR